MCCEGEPNGPCPECGATTFIKQVVGCDFDEPAPGDITEHYQLRCKGCGHLVDRWPVHWYIGDERYTDPEPETVYYPKPPPVDPIPPRSVPVPEIRLPRPIPRADPFSRRALFGEFHSCFISYSSFDQTFAERLYTELMARRVRVWFAPHDLKSGDRFQEEIEGSISRHEKIIIILSGASVASRWVEREVNAAREREEREKCTLLFPIRIDNAVMDATSPWAADIRRQRHIGDFTRWEEQDAYEKALSRLLRDLRRS